MSSVLIRGMNMPEKCGSCDLFHAESPMHCTVVKGYKTVGAPYGMPRPDWCPLVALPDHHGRLVDADALHVLFENQWHYLQCLNWDENPTAEAKQTGINWCINTLHDDAKTIIEAEGDEE